MREVLRLSQWLGRIVVALRARTRDSACPPDGCAAAIVEEAPSRRFTRPLLGPYKAVFYRFFRLSWETSALRNYNPEDCRDSGSRK